MPTETGPGWRVRNRSGIYGSQHHARQTRTGLIPVWGIGQGGFQEAEAKIDAARVLPSAVDTSMVEAHLQ